MKQCHGRQFSFIWVVILFAVLMDDALASHNHNQTDPACTRSRTDWFAEFEKPENRIAFQNDGGLVDGGVCWWHSRLQRSAVFLARFTSPEKSKPSQSQARRIIETLIRFKKVVLIPGYQNFLEFSRDYASLIQHELNQWQLRDAFLRQQWIRGLYGRYSMPAKTLRNRRNKIFRRYRLSKPGLWIMAQMPGITSHSLLLLSIDRSHDQAGLHYKLRVIDSNRPMETREVWYHDGDRSLTLSGTPFVPYVGFELDQNKIGRSLARHCRKH
jgi:hypothetical protein